MAVKHKERSHAKLSASASHRWLACPPSAQLCADLPDTATDYAKEGTCAHELAEYKINKLLGIDAADPTENLEYFDQEMADCTDAYAEYIAEQISKCTDPIVMVEQRLDFSRYVPDGFGTGDCVIVADDVLTVCDYKHGKGVAVSAEHNSQMMLYALGVLGLFDSLYDITEIRMVIFQPRMDNVSEFSMSVTDLLDWAENSLKPTAALAAKGEGEFCAGDHCRFCKVKATCRKRAEYNLVLAQYDFAPIRVRILPEGSGCAGIGFKPAAPADTLEDAEIEAILEKADALVAWANDVKEFALSQALSGKVWNGYKLVEGKSNRKYTDEAKVAQAVQNAGYDPYAAPEILGITAMTKLLGKKKFTEILGELLYKPTGKPTLVPASDKRKAWNPAENDFKEEN